jgi:hypothetical protein
MNMPYALRAICAPGTIVPGYQRGHEILPGVIDAWELVEGEDWQADRPEGAMVPTVPRPDAGANRAAWEGYAISRGMPADKAAAATQEELEAVGDEPAAEDHPRPADSARKSEWVTYVNDHPQATDEDRAWAGDDSTTKADLMAWQPRPADPVAVAATEQANG